MDQRGRNIARNTTAPPDVTAPQSTRSSDLSARKLRQSSLCIFNLLICIFKRKQIIQRTKFEKSLAAISSRDRPRSWGTTRCSLTRAGEQKQKVIRKNRKQSVDQRPNETIRRLLAIPSPTRGDLTGRQTSHGRSESHRNPTGSVQTAAEMKRIDCGHYFARWRASLVIRFCRRRYKR